MASYTNKQKEDIKNLIDQYTEEYLEVYSRADVKKQAIDAMTAGKTKIKVADSVYDYLYEKHKGSVVISAALNTCIPGDVMLLLRQEIIKLLS